jgi:hypothetical protein
MSRPSYHSKANAIQQQASNKTGCGGGYISSQAEEDMGLASHKST